MQCPRCSSALNAGTYEGHEAFHCDECTGTLFNQPGLGAAIERMSIDLFSTVSTELPVPELPDSTDLIDCPKCGVSMENYGYMGTNKVMLDACNQCQLVWVDPMELATMAKMRTRLDKNMDRLRQAHVRSDLLQMYMDTPLVKIAFLSGWMRL